MRILHFSIVTFVSVLLCLVLYTPVRAADCNIYGPQYAVPSGYGASFNVFNTSQMMLSIACNEDESITITTGNNDPLTYIYKNGYYYDQTWKQFSYTCSNMIADAWCPGQVNKTLTNVPTADANFLVSYTCQWGGTKWNCGCSNTSCSSPAWQLQGWRPSSGSTIGGTVGDEYPWPLPNATVISGPITLKDGESVRGKKISNPSGDCIKLAQRASNIVIEDNDIGPCGGKGINMDWQNGNVTVRDNYIHDTETEAIWSNLSHHILIEHNILDNIRSGYRATGSKWDEIEPTSSKDISIVFTGNFVKNVHRVNTTGGNVVQMQYMRGGGIDITNNIGINYEGKSETEDLISLYKSHGVSGDPILVKGNMFVGGGPSKYGGGIILGDANGSFQLAEDNIMVNPGQYGLQIAGGHDVAFKGNKVFQEKDNSYISPIANVGIQIHRVNADGNGTPVGGCYNVTMTDNGMTFYRGADYVTNDKPGWWLYPLYIQPQDDDCGISKTEVDNANRLDWDGDQPRLDASILPAVVRGFYQ